MSMKDHPAFPISYQVTLGNPDMLGERHEDDVVVTHSGLDIRTYIATGAMQALIPFAEENWPGDIQAKVAKCAVSFADALIAELEKDAE